MKHLLIIFALLFFSSQQVVSEVLIGKDQYLYVPKSEARRLLLEPGTVLLRKTIDQSEVYKKRIRVYSPGGVEGEVKSRSVDSVNDMSGTLAYVKKEITIKGAKYSIGTIFPVTIIDDEEELIYEVTYPRVIYNVKNNAFTTRSKTIEFTSKDFNDSFNFIDPTEAAGNKFPLWAKDVRHESTEWGCGESKKVVSVIDASASASIEAEGGFFTFFQAKAEASTGATTATTFEKVLEDDDYKHRITYWNLVAADKPDRKLLSVALEKISICDTSKGVNNSYVIKFDKKLNHDDIKLNSIWAEDKGFKRGGGSPVRIDTQTDLHKFEHALKDFKFSNTIDGYDVKRAVIDFAVWYTVNLNYAP
jgi:hypothetical protein